MGEYVLLDMCIVAEEILVCNVETLADFMVLDGRFRYYFGGELAGILP